MLLSQSIILAALVLWVYVLLLYVWALIKRNYSIIDYGWSFGILLAAASPLFLQETIGLRQILALVLVATWAFRLGIHLVIRGWGKGESSRYENFRAVWGKHAWFYAFFKIFILQGLLMFVIALPAVFIGAFEGKDLGLLDVLAVILWIKGFAWEMIADHQLAVFKRETESQGRILKKGLWRYSRHPNYFGEVLQWLGIWVLSLSVPGGWLTVISPLLITFILLKVSGVPVLESEHRRNPEFRKYAKETPTFFPRFQSK